MYFELTIKMKNKKNLSNQLFNYHIKNELRFARFTWFIVTDFIIINHRRECYFANNIIKIDHEPYVENRVDFYKF